MYNFHLRYIAKALLLSFLVASLARNGQSLAQQQLYKELNPDEPLGAPVASYPIQQQIFSQPASIATARPPYLVPTAIPGLGTTIIRISDAPVFGPGARVYRHFYSKRQPWNSNGTQILLAHIRPYYLLDGRTYQLIKVIDAPDEPIWSNTRPSIIYGVRVTNGITAFVEFDIRTETDTIIQQFPEYNSLSIGIWEGNISSDDRYAPLVERNAEGTYVVVYDIKKRVIVAKKEFLGYSRRDIDWFTVSPSGKYIVLGDNTKTRAHEVYELQTMNLLRRLPIPSGSHADLGYDSNGREVLVTQTNSSAITSIRLDNGVERIELSAGHMARNQHISCRNIQRPGYCYVSTFSHSRGFEAFMYREVFALKLDGTGTVERFAQNFAAPLPLADNSYSRQAHAVPNRDGSLVIFSSDWEDASSNAAIYDYVVGIQPLRPR